ncbi:Hypothetical protein NTJ_13353 [Nesidiocoris tenuis]|nr:Hypothetical protein NTJ_13353 [Nesidiocoris tenuis]
MKRPQSLKRLKILLSTASLQPSTIEAKSPLARSPDIALIHRSGQIQLLVAGFISPASRLQVVARACETVLWKWYSLASGVSIPQQAMPKMLASIIALSIAATPPMATHHGLAHYIASEEAASTP